MKSADADTSNTEHINHEEKNGVDRLIDVTMQADEEMSFPEISRNAKTIIENDNSIIVAVEQIIETGSSTIMKVEQREDTDVAMREENTEGGADLRT